MRMFEERDPKVVGEADVISVEGSSLDESNGLDRVGVDGGRSILVVQVERIVGSSWSKSSFGGCLGESEVEFCAEFVDEAGDWRKYAWYGMERKEKVVSSRAKELKRNDDGV